MIDQYNDLNELFDVELVFLYSNVSYDNFNQNKLLALINCKYVFLLKGLSVNDRVVRFGILRKIRKFEPDVIISYEYSFTTQYLLFLKQLGIIHSKIGTTIDDSLEICKNVQSNIRSFARKIAIKKLDFIVVLSKEVSGFYIDNFTLNENEVIISPILQNPERLRNNVESIEIFANNHLQKYSLKGKKVVLFAGRLVEAKGITGFIDNVSKTLLENEKVVLVLVGSGEEEEKIKTILKIKGLYEKVLLPGRFDGDELYAWYVCASGFVLPSIYEPYGAVVNESLIFGTKVLCSKYAGSSNLIHSDNGLIFDPLNEKQTEEKFNLFIKSIDVVEKIDMNNKKSLMNYEKTDFIKEWYKVTN